MPSSASSKTAKQQQDDDASSGGWKDKACRVCDSFSFFKKSMSSSNAPSSDNKGKAVPNDDDSHQPASSSQPSRTEDAWTTPDGELPCPPDYTELGNSAWAFLHTMASYYPEEPEVKVCLCVLCGVLISTTTSITTPSHPQEQTAAQQLIHALAHLYPCTSCAQHLQQELQTNPPAVESRNALEQWMCRMHNSVNARLGKPMFDCSRVGERWRDGPPEGRDCVAKNEG